MSTSDAQLQTLITADNSQFIQSTLQAKQQISDLASQIQNQFGVSAQTANSVAAQSFKNTQTEVRATTSEMSGLKNAVLSVGTALISAFSVGELLEKLSSASESIRQLNKDITTLGANPQGLQTLEFAASQLDVSNESLTTSLQRLQKNLGSALLDPTGAAAKAFGQLGVSAQDLSKLNIDQVFGKIGTQLKNFDSAQQKSLATTLFGKGSGQELELILSDLDQFAAKRASLNIGLSQSDLDTYKQLNDYLNQATAKINDDFKKALVDLTPTILALTGALTDFVSGVGSLQNYVSDHLIGNANQYNPNNPTSSAAETGYLQNSIFGSIATQLLDEGDFTDRILDVLGVKSDPNQSDATYYKSNHPDASLLSAVRKTTGNLDIPTFGAQINAPTVSQAPVQELIDIVQGSGDALRTFTDKLKDSSATLGALFGTDNKTLGGQYIKSQLPKDLPQATSDFFNDTLAAIKDKLAANPNADITGDISALKYAQSTTSGYSVDDQGNVSQLSTSGMDAAIKDIQAAQTKQQNQNQLKVSFTVDKEGIINAFATSSNGIQLMSNTTKNVTSTEAQQTGL